MVNYKKKYLKYKMKYLELKGGMNTTQLNSDIPKGECEELFENFNYDDYINQGMESQVYGHKTDPTRCFKRFILVQEKKLGMWGQKIKGGGITETDFINNKLIPLNILSNVGLGTNIYKYYICEDLELKKDCIYMEIDRIYGDTLETLDKSNKLNDTHIEEYKKIKSRLIELGILSGSFLDDFHLDNIMYDGDRYYVIDW